VWRYKSLISTSAIHLSFNGGSSALSVRLFVVHLYCLFCFPDLNWKTRTFVVDHSFEINYSPKTCCRPSAKAGRMHIECKIGRQKLEKVTSHNSEVVVLNELDIADTVRREKQSLSSIP
jgi:hypothetical protein